MSDDIPNETLSSYECGCRDGYQFARDNKELPLAIPVPDIIIDDGLPERYRKGFRVGFLNGRKGRNSNAV